jgi:hypothetical protein
MVSVCIEVGNETGSLKVTVRARSIERAVRVVAERYPRQPHPGRVPDKP